MNKKTKGNKKDSVEDVKNSADISIKVTKKLSSKDSASKEKLEFDDSVQEVLKKISKRFGDGSAFILGQHNANAIPVISSGSLSLDIALGVGGYPKGRMIEIFGAEGCGKTTLALKAVAECQAQGGKIVFMDAEHALDVSYAQKLGCDIEKFILCQPNDGEQALEMVEMFIKSASIDMIVIDSVAALTPRAELEASISASHIGLQARMMSQAMRKLTSVINQRQTTVIFINQLRMKIGPFVGGSTTTGGTALKFFSSIRIEVKKGIALKVSDKVMGHIIKIKIVKNKVAPPFKEAEYHLFYYDLNNKSMEIAHMSVELGIFEQRGPWFSYKDLKIQGKMGIVALLKEDPALREELINKIKVAAGLV